MRCRITWWLAPRPLLLLLATAQASASEHHTPTLLAKCKRNCSGSSACVVVQGDAPPCSGAGDWTSESAGFRAECVPLADTQCLEQVEGAIRVVSISGGNSGDLVLGEGVTHHWRHAQLISVEDRDASRLVLHLAAFSELSTLSLRNASLSAFPAQIFSLPKLHSLDLRGNSFSNPVHLSESERGHLAQLESFAIDQSALDTQCDDPQPIDELYAVCDSSASSSASSSSSDGVHPETASQTLDETSVLFVSTGSAATDSSSSPSSGSGDHTPIDALTWVIIVSVVVVVLLIVLIAYCYTKWDRRRTQQLEVGEGIELDTEPPAPWSRRFLTRRRRRSRLLSIAKWFDDPELRRWAIDPSETVPLREIHAGAFSTIWLAQYASETVVLKRFLPVANGSSSSSDSQRDFHAAFTSELSLLSTLAHPKIIALVGVAWTQPSLLPVVDMAMDDREKVALVVEFMERGDLRAYLSATKDCDAGRSWSRRKISIAADVAEAIAFLHAQSPPVLHRNVTSTNILLDANYTAKLADFSLSRHLDGSDSREPDALAMTKRLGTSRCIAPEVLTADGAYSPAVDVYAFGIVLAELDSHEPPLSNVSTSNSKQLLDKTVFKLARAGTLAPAISDACPKPVATLMLECLSVDPNARPVASYAASRLRAMLERLRRVSDVGEDVAGGADSGSMIEMDVDGGITSSGRVFGLIAADSFLGVDGAYASASGTSGDESKRSESPSVSKYSLMQDSS